MAGDHQGAQERLLEVFRRCLQPEFTLFYGSADYFKKYGRNPGRAGEEDEETHVVGTICS